MAEKLIIENFGPIKRVEIDLKRSLVLIGPQSSGKSIIAKIITICRDFSFVINRQPINDLLDNYNILSYLTNETYIEYQCDSYSFKLLQKEELFEFNKDHKLLKLQKEYSEISSKFPQLSLDEQLNLVKGQQKEVDVLIDKAKKEQDDSRKENIWSEVREKHKDVKTNLQFLQIRAEKRIELVNEMLHFINYSQYIPAERSIIPVISGITLNLVNNKVPLPKSILEFGSEFEKAKFELKNLYIDFIKIDFRYTNNEDRIYLNNNKYFKLSESSSGFQAVIPLILVIEYLHSVEKVGHAFVIEEPELNLYPETQKELVKFLVSKCSLQNPVEGYFNELIITTHSPYILTEINNLLLAYKVGTKKPEASKIVDRKAWLNPENFNAYLIEKGKAKKIFNSKSGLINDESLDRASESILYEFEKLMDLI